MEILITVCTFGQINRLLTKILCMYMIYEENLITFSEISEHDNHVDILLPDHSPEINDCTL